MTDPTQSLLTVREVAEQLGCSVANIYALMNRGGLAFVRIGKSKGYRVRVNDLQAFVEERRTQYETPEPKSRRPRLKHIKF